MFEISTDDDTTDSNCLSETSGDEMSRSHHVEELDTFVCNKKTMTTSIDLEKKATAVSRKMKHDGLMQRVRGN